MHNKSHKDKKEKMEKIKEFDYPFSPDFNNIEDGAVKLTVVRLVVKINQLIDKLNEK